MVMVASHIHIATSMLLTSQSYTALVVSDSRSRPDGWTTEGAVLQLSLYCSVWHVLMRNAVIRLLSVR